MHDYIYIGMHMSAPRFSRPVSWLLPKKIRSSSVGVVLTNTISIFYLRREKVTNQAESCWTMSGERYHPCERPPLWDRRVPVRSAFQTSIFFVVTTTSHSLTHFMSEQNLPHSLQTCAQKGKTSLLNILAGRASSRGRLTIQSDIRLNNYAIDPTSIDVRQMIAFVAQDDSLQITSTPREAIRFSAKLRLPRSTKECELDQLTEQMLTELGLTDCADTVVGGPLLKGISGGERKRTSVGVELVVRPTMIFLDEPTSGLDSFSAVQVCLVLKKVAESGASVLFTIHQPSSEIFSSFDNLILLSRGRAMYQGAVEDVPDFFRSKGFPCPDQFNPADFIMVRMVCSFEGDGSKFSTSFLTS
jgi:ABC-type multidrug transport system ATPase subunit